MAGLRLVGRAHALHPVVEDEAQQQDDQEVDQRERRRRAEVELADGLLRQVLRLRKVVALPGPPPVSTKGSV